MALPLAREAAITLITEEWPPYNYVERGRLTGVSVTIVQALQRELGRHDPIQVYPSQRAKLILESRSRTMMFSMFRTPQRETRYKWIGPIGRDAIYFYQRRGSPLRIRTLQDAKAVPVIASRQAGLVFNTLIALGFTNLDATAYSSKQVYGKLLRGRADLAISDSPLGSVIYSWSWDCQRMPCSKRRSRWWSRTSISPRHWTFPIPRSPSGNRRWIGSRRGESWSRWGAAGPERAGQNNKAAMAALLLGTR